MLHALVIDDNSLNNDVLVTLLLNAGVDAVAVESPRFLPEVIDQMPGLDVIFLDLEFPNHNGFDLLQEFRADTRFDGIPIVAYSVHTSEVDEARRAGFHSFLGKPLNTQQFPTQLARILNNQPVWEV